jgi:LCP family protein required for cell wall assembly
MPESPETAQWRRDVPRPSYVAPSKGRRFRVAHLLMYGFGILLGLATLFAVYARLAPRFQRVPNRVADGLKSDRVNIVLIGIGGDAHPGSGKDLADAIMVLCLKPSSRQAAMISIPRDYYVDMGRYGRQRVNAAHAIGGRDYPGGGPALVIDSVATILDQPIHAFVRVDFAAFEKIVDELGGVDIFVHRPFHDFLFNDSFQQGWQRMNGKRALAYARYRYVLSEEGNNYARELRQQQVLNAVRDRVSQLGPQQAMRLIGVARVVSKHTATNLTTPQMIELYTKYREMKRDQIRHVSLAPLTEPVRTNDPADPTPAVGPRNGDAARIREMARSVFTDMRPVITESQIPLGSEAAAAAPNAR